VDRHWVPIETFTDESNPIFNKTPGRVHLTDHMEEGWCEGTPKETDVGMASPTGRSLGALNLRPMKPPSTLLWWVV
jgi:hypothetical protein